MADCTGDRGAEVVSQPAAKTDFSHPVYKKLAQINCEINQMTKEDIQIKLKELHLDTRGTKDVIKKRLKTHFKNWKLAQNSIRNEQGVSHYDYILVIDFEATCEMNAPEAYQHEIIEFPIVVINCSTNTVESKFRSYVRPVLHSKLSPFCVELTGITQAMVNSAPTFPEVLAEVEHWLRDRNLIGTLRKKVAILTDGPWDILRFLVGQCQISKLPIPSWASEWINIRKLYANFYGHRCTGGVEGMLSSLGLFFEGRPHSGLDDSVNIARIALHMAKDGCALKVNERLWRRRRHTSAFAKEGADNDDHCGSSGDSVGESGEDESADEHTAVTSPDSVPSPLLTGNVNEVGTVVDPLRQLTIGANEV